MLLLQATVKRFQFDLYINLEGQHTGQKHTFPPVWKGIVSPVKTYCSIYISNYIPSMKRINTQGYYQHETTPEYVFLTLRTNHSWECIWL